MSTSPTVRTKIATVVVGCGLLASAFAGVPIVVNAQTIVDDPRGTAIQGFSLVKNIVSAVKTSALATKEYVLDGLAWSVAKLAVQSMQKSLLNWINSGFDGSPAFVTDLNKNLQGVNDAVARRFFQELSSQDITSSPFQDHILDTVRLGYYLSTSPESFYTRYPYTLNQVSPDAKAFLAGDFSQGGFNAWFATVMNPQNNPYGARDLANRVLSSEVAGATNGRVQELSWNKGFMSWRGECKEYEGGNQTLTSAPVCTTNAAGELSCTQGDTTVVSLDGREKCQLNEIVTPGALYAPAINDALGAVNDQLITADEIDEVIGALMNQLVGHVLGANGGGGLRGVSRPQAGGGSSFLDQATSPSNQTAVAGSISQNFTATITDQKKYITDFQAAWTKIRTAAQAALTKCGTNVTPNPQEVIDRATILLTKAATALTALEEIEAKIVKANEAAGEQTALLLEISTEYQALLSSGTLPTAEEIAEAQTESQDTGGTKPGSLYSQFTRINSALTCSAAE